MTGAVFEGLTTSTADELVAHVDAAARRFRALAGDIDPRRRVRRSAWTSGDVIRHVVTVVRRYVDRDVSTTDRLAADAAALARLNRGEVDALRGLPHGAVLDALTAVQDRFRRTWTSALVDPAARFPFHAGLTIDAAVGMGNLIGEYLVHGHDLAVAARRPWRIDERDATLILNAAFQLVPPFVKPRARTMRPLTVGFVVDDGRPWAFHFGPDGLVSGPAEASERVDVVVRGPAPALVLSLYGRIGPLAAVRAGIRPVGGRRPWRLPGVMARLDRP